MHNTKNYRWEIQYILNSTTLAHIKNTLIDYTVELQRTELQIVEFKTYPTVNYRSFSIYDWRNYPSYFE